MVDQLENQESKPSVLEEYSPPTTMEENIAGLVILSLKFNEEYPDKLIQYDMEKTLQRSLANRLAQKRGNYLVPVIKEFLHNYISQELGGELEEEKQQAVFENVEENMGLSEEASFTEIQDKLLQNTVHAISALESEGESTVESSETVEDEDQI